MSDPFTMTREELEERNKLVALKGQVKNPDALKPPTAEQAAKMMTEEADRRAQKKFWQAQREVQAVMEQRQPAATRFQGYPPAVHGIQTFKIKL
jgi:hypothetical protein